MTRRLALPVFATLALLALVPTASARTWPGLRMGGDVRARHWVWARDASVNVPLPDAAVTVWNGDPEYFPNVQELYVPFAGTREARRQGWSLRAERGLFLHELGHVYDFADMTTERRDAFEVLAGTSCRWWARHCLSDRWVSGPGVTVDVAPGEMFAEMYAACALGLTERGYQDAGFNTYGWVPPDGTDQALCAIIG